MVGYREILCYVNIERDKNDNDISKEIMEF